MRLNAVPFLFAPEHAARADAPGTFADLWRWHSTGGLVMPVWEGASARTVWGTPQANHAFRAWHDATHLRLGADFTLEGELATAREQCAMLERAGLGRACGVVWHDVAGQAAYYAAHGTFPDQEGWHDNLSD